MNTSRRSAIRSIVSACGILAATRSTAFAAAGSSEDKLNHPDGTTLQNGDLIWPRNGCTFVPYSGRAAYDYDREKAEWNAGRARYLDRVKRSDEAASEASRRIANLDFAEFLIEYEGDIQPGQFRPYGGDGPLYTGHVAIASIEGGQPWLIEAITASSNCVRKIPYDKWLKERGNPEVWQGRLKGITEAQQVGIAREASSHLNVPYDFWNFDLLDANGFYCSKLAWMSIYRATGSPVDENPNPKRHIWFSPKQLMECKPVNVIFSPGTYSHGC